MADGLEWLGYVPFGYQGYKNNLFGNIAAYEAITAIGREMLTRAKEAANDLGYEVIAANTDSLFIKPIDTYAKPLTPVEIQPLLDEIKERTELIIELEGIFSWIMFMRSKLNPHIGATNRYFGRFRDGSSKVRGTAQRRRDTCKWEVDGEVTLMHLLASEEDPDRLSALVAEIIDFIRRHFAALDNEQIPIENLKCGRKLTRELDQYRGTSESAKAAQQLVESGKEVNVGRRINYIYTHGQKSDVLAWDLPQPPTYPQVNKKRYKEKFLDTSHQLIQLLGISMQDIQSLVDGGIRQLELWPENKIDQIIEYFGDELRVANNKILYTSNLDDVHE